MRERHMQGDIVRAFQMTTTGLIRRSAERHRTAASLALREIDQQFQIPVNGQAGTTIAWASVSLDFDYPFSSAPGLRDSDLDLPQFTWGAHLDMGDAAFSVHVGGWDIDPDDDSVRGATVRIGVHSPGTDAAVDYSGAIHATFQGFGALHEDETEMA